MQANKKKLLIAPVECEFILSTMKERGEEFVEGH